MEENKIYNEPCMDTLSRMSDDSVDCVITSPPYWQLRDYGYSGQWGLEPTFQEYLEHLWGMMDEIYRVLKPTGTCWINLGDSYSTQSGTSLAMSRDNAYEKTEATYLTNRGESENLIKDKSLPNKCLLLLPHRFAIGCMERGWIIRNDVIWAKRNGMPESVTDRFSKKHEYFFFMTKKPKYYFDLDAIRDRVSSVSMERYKYQFTGQEGGNSSNFKGDKSHLAQNKSKYPTLEIDEKMTYVEYESDAIKNSPKGKNPGSVSDFWDIPTRPSSNKHYASYNDSLLVKPVLAGCPEGGVIYDPFMGTGSTAEVSLRANRKFIGSEMSEEYVEICEKRLKPFLAQTKLF